MHEFYDTEKASKVRQLTEATFIAFTGDHMFKIQANHSIFKNVINHD